MMQNTGKYPGRKLQCLRHKGKYLPGSYKYFSGKILFAKPKPLHCQMQKGPLRLTLENNRFDLFYKGMRLTDGLGLYTSILSRDFKFYQDSSIATWHTISQDDDTLVVRGDWLNLPIYQTWRLKLESDDTISLEISLDVKKQIDLAEEQTNIMLDNRYKKWSVIGSDARGEFTDTFDPKKWPAFYQDKNNPVKITVDKFITGNRLMPAVALDCLKTDKNASLKIKNTDSAFKSRLLQYARQDTRYPRGSYKYFSGKILFNGAD